MHFFGNLLLRQRQTNLSCKLCHVGGRLFHLPFQLTVHHKALLISDITFYGFRKKAGFNRIRLRFLCPLSWAVWPWADVFSSLSLFPHLSNNDTNDVYFEKSIWGSGEAECDGVPYKWSSVIWIWVVRGISLSSSESPDSKRRWCYSGHLLWLSGQKTNLKY